MEQKTENIKNDAEIIGNIKAAIERRSKIAASQGVNRPGYGAGTHNQPRLICMTDQARSSCFIKAMYTILRLLKKCLNQM